MPPRKDELRFDGRILIDRFVSPRQLIKHSLFGIPALCSKHPLPGFDARLPAAYRGVGRCLWQRIRPRLEVAHVVKTPFADNQTRRLDTSTLAECQQEIKPPHMEMGKRSGFLRSRPILR